ncbi:hypothetical protein MPL3365_270051 [Mesorhizobium plurifarium]|uniref:Uncharacterized protein n=1 Tax=Mesorhizobium plurifarium TaxID=69974 RepID=A0A090GUS2_MESPL|nr:hypothetical protein MPL3365_270051 [Mesorhizobium plurifarium]
MIDLITNFGVSAFAGFLLGLVGITIIAPNTNGGAFLIVVIGIAIGVILGAVYKALRPSKATKDD